MKYFIDFILIAERLTPSFLKNETKTSWFTALLKPLQTINSSLLVFVSETKKIVSYNSQKKIFETYLNDVFDNEFRRIYINNTFSFVERLFIFFKNENQTPDFVFFKSENQPKFLKSKSEFAVSFDFIVYVPLSLVYDQNKMNEIIKLTKLAGKRFSIQNF